MWVLVAVLLANQGVAAQPIDIYKSMEDCFRARESVIDLMPKPKVNYELICVRTDLFKGV